jgi:DNA/RNA-binding domain of Phe-tRNA-synthetase-like protein
VWLGQSDRDTPATPTNTEGRTVVEITIDSKVSGLALALVEAADVAIGEAGPDLRTYANEVAGRVRQTGLPGGEERRGAVRDLLRRGGFKPAGRSKPAQEYLWRVVSQGGLLPSISNAVDLINAISLDSGLPISLVSTADTRRHWIARYGLAGERFVFNRAGQELDVEGLICLCAGTGDSARPLATPVKDSMEAKVTPEHHQLLACLYIPASAVAPDEAQRWATQLAQGFRSWCGATRLEFGLVPNSW